MCLAISLLYFFFVVVVEANQKPKRQRLGKSIEFNEQIKHPTSKKKSCLWQKTKKKKKVLSAALGRQ